MSEMELTDLFGVISPTVRAAIRAVYKSGVLKEYEAQKYIRLENGYYADVYNFLYGIFENVDDITAAHAKGAELNLDFAASYEAVPYHPGAVAYFADKGITVNGK